MKVYLELPVQSRGIGRVRDALVKWAPKEVQVVSDPTEADLEVIHVIGRLEHVKDRINHLKLNKRSYAMIQYCLRSTMNPSTRDWITLWLGSKLVWSYYDLWELCKEDMIPSARQISFPNFYYAPLGVDSDIFYDREQERNYTILASGQHALAEGVRECAFATKAVRGEMVHLGYELRRGEDIKCISGISDEQLATVYSSCKFVSGLRRVEGFELPVIEGLLCGARPIVFDRPEMRKWFGEFAVFISEGSREKVIDDLEKIFRIGTYPVTQYEIALAKERFNWQTIISKFWERILA